MTSADPPSTSQSTIDWSEPHAILKQEDGDKPIPKVVANRMLELSSGEWILPFWRQRSYQVCDTKSPNSAGVLRSLDGGKTWHAYGDLLMPAPMAHWVIEGSAVELAEGSVLLVLRSTEGFLFKSISLDKGVSWSEVVPTSVLNPDAKAHTVRLHAGLLDRLMLAYNNHDRPFHGMAKGRGSISGKRRDTLMLAVSKDGGESWDNVARVDPPVNVTSHGEENPAANLMFHYPTMLQRNHSNSLLVAYSRTYYPDSSAVDPPHLDGIWLAELDLAVAAGLDIVP